METVLVIPTSVLDGVGIVDKFTSCTMSMLANTILDPNYMRFLPRDDMENDPTYKQLIPYCCIMYQQKIFSYTRGTAQGESRLHAKKSIGIGGHINDKDMTESLNPYYVGMYRELSEEVIINEVYTNNTVGVINDDSNDVGRVHLGIAQIVKVEGTNVQAREPSMLNTGFVDLEEAYNNIDEYETWSQIFIRHLYERRT